VRLASRTNVPPRSLGACRINDMRQHVETRSTRGYHSSLLVLQLLEVLDSLTSGLYWLKQ